MPANLPHLLRRAMSVLAFGIVLGSVAMADPKRESLGALDIAVDTTRWRVERPAPHVLTIVPIDALAKRQRHITIMQAISPDLADCERLARVQLPASLYNEAKAWPIDVGGSKAVALHASTRCRNATPRGVAICVPHQGKAYVVVDRIEGCRAAGNPFSSTDLFDELIRSIRFSP